MVASTQPNGITGGGRRRSSNVFSQFEHKRIISVTHMIPYVACIQTKESQTDQQSQSQKHQTDDAIVWNLKPRRGHSALYAGIRSLSAECENFLVGFAGEIYYDEEENGNLLDQTQFTDQHKKSLQTLLAKEKVIPVFLDDEEHHGHYEGYCKTVLWPLFHYMLWDVVTDGREERKNWDQYVKVNSRFVDKIVEIYQPGDIVWIHDYHLLLVPEMLRQRIPDAPIGLFIHAPFPSSEIFRCLPKRKEILHGMLGANQIGFQTYSYASHFTSSCTRVLGYETTPKGVDTPNLVVSLGTFPIGIDAEKTEEQRKDPGVAVKMASIKEMYAGKKIIVGRDKLDLVKGVMQKLQAFEKFLCDYPQWKNKVVLIQVTSPALTESPKLERKVSELVAHINGTYGTLEFNPVHHYHNQNVDQDEYFALLSVADIGLITSVRDGMNTTSLEYIMCQQENHGPLILSEFTGMAGSLSSAIMVNPWDYAGVAKAINEALEMSREEKLVKHLQLYHHVTVHTAQYWAKSFIKELRANLVNQVQSFTTPYLKIDFLLNQYKRSKQRLIMLDYDGTLTPIVRTPNAAVPSPQVIEVLKTLSSNPCNNVWVISGRDQNDLDQWLGDIPKLGLSAEHGSFLKYPDTGKWINLTEDIDMNWKNDVSEVFRYYSERTQGSFIEYKQCSITWHYRLADPVYGAFQAKEMQNHLEGALLPKRPVEILLGKKTLEVRPTIVNKGEIVKRMLVTMPDVDFIICAGDDKTDEDMFRVLRNSELDEDAYFCITIGSANKKTLAQWHVTSPEEVTQLIQKLNMADELKA
ncbi:14011_t:CDS:10 [Ambispora leptoticha]|uniref:14011_t:CDS:1 n=1 Tax=Ambispora leptoticha TaxID=144679 RepID=A0A9N8V6I4_9GLOM|nr:14011_t:CDS:10 [Ambispora leptoticha]